SIPPPSLFTTLTTARTLVSIQTWLFLPSVEVPSYFTAGRAFFTSFPTFFLGAVFLLFFFPLFAGRIPFGSSFFISGGWPERHYAAGHGIAEIHIHFVFRHEDHALVFRRVPDHDAAAFVRARRFKAHLVATDVNLAFRPAIIGFFANHIGGKILSVGQASQ